LDVVNLLMAAYMSAEQGNTVSFPPKVLETFSVAGRPNVFVGSHFSNLAHAEYDLHPKTAVVHTRPLAGATRLSWWKTGWIRSTARQTEHEKVGQITLPASSRSV